MAKTQKQTGLSETERLRRENQRLRLQLDKAELGMVFAKGGAEAIVNEVHKREDTLRRQINERDNRIAELEQMLPMDVMNPNSIPEDAPIRQSEENGHWKQTIVGMTLIFRDSATPDFRIVKRVILHPDTLENAVAETSGRLLSNVTLPMDLPKTPTGFEELGDSEFSKIAAELSLCNSEEDFDNKKKELFNLVVWPKLNAAANSELHRSEALDKFYKYCNAAKTNILRRRMSYQQAGWIANEILLSDNNDLEE